MRQVDSESNAHEQLLAAERRVDAVLAALEAVQPRPGLEQRVLRGVLAKVEVVEAGVPRRWRWGLEAGALWKPFLAAMALGTVFAAGVSGIRHYGSGQPDGVLRSSKAAQDLQPSAGSENAQYGRKLDGQDNGNSARAGDDAEVRPSRLSQAVGARPIKASMRTKPSLAEQDVVQAQVRNMPAPEEPFTDQERLLVQLAHRHAPQQLIAMTAVAQHAGDVAEQREYAAFFAPAFRTVEEIEALQKDQKP